MEQRFNIPFQELLTLIKSLSPAQRAKVRKVLDEEAPIPDENDEIMQLLLNGPTYSKDEIHVIEANRKSISAWRKKN